MEKFIKFYKDLFGSNRYWFNTAAAWFGLAAVFGLIAFFVNPNLMQIIADTFAERFGENPALDFSLAMQIFQQNIIASGVALFGGIVLGLAPLLVITVNGFLVGYVVSSIWFKTDFFTGLIFLAAGLIPHGVLELPAFLIAAALGLRIGWEWLYKESSGSRGKILKSNLKQALVVVPGIAFMLFIAALIEVFVSGRIVDSL